MSINLLLLFDDNILTLFGSYSNIKFILTICEIFVKLLRGRKSYCIIKIMTLLMTYCFFVGVAVKEVLHNGRLRKTARKQNKREEQAD
jgi:hypothetical protein